MHAASNLIGTRFGNYEIQALLGSGGMSYVYRAFDHNLHRQVAIKVLTNAVAAQPGFVDRFRQEARLIASLRHPHIVQIYDLGSEHGYTYMVQELLPGPTLEKRLHDLSAQNNKLDRHDIVTIATQLSSALDGAHNAGIIHRDVKPSNIMWNAAGSLVLTDFGIAKNTLSGNSQTQTGMVIGTPNYLSPEQAQGLTKLTPASDIYAFGVVVYEMITGKTPFSGDTPMQVVLGHLQHPPPPLQPQRPDMPSGVETIVQRALSKDPAARFQTAGEFARMLEQNWSAAFMPATGTTIHGIHEQETYHWPGPSGNPPANATPPVVQARPSQPAAPVQSSPKAIGSSEQPTHGSPPMLLPILSILLAVLFIGGITLVVRGNNEAAEASIPPGAEAEAPSDSNSQPPAEDQPQGEPPVEGQPVGVQPPEEEQPSQDQPDVPQESPLPTWRASLDTGVDEGRAGPRGDKLIALSDEAWGAIFEEDNKKALKKFDDMRKELEKGESDGEIAPEFAQEIRDGIDQIIVFHRLD
ncbi:MAG: protein kinase [Chloroflexota bacterium]